MLKFLDKILLIGTVISIALGILSTFIFKLDAGTGFIVSLVNINITMLIDLFARLDESEKRLQETLKDSENQLKSQLTEAIKMHNEWDEILSGESPSPVIPKMYDILTKYEFIKNKGFIYFLNYADKTILKTLDIMKHLEDGEIELNDSDMINLTNQIINDTQSGEIIKAVHTTGVDFWNTNSGERYFMLCKNAINRGVRITRVWVTHDIDLDRATLKEQSNNGIEILVIKKDDQLGLRIRSLIKDYLIINDKILLQPTVINEIYQGGRISIDENEVGRFVEDFHSLSKSAKKFTDA
jgi:hypothetical protein